VLSCRRIYGTQFRKKTHHYSEDDPPIKSLPAAASGPAKSSIRRQQGWSVRSAPAISQKNYRLICEALEIANPRDVATRLDDDQKGTHTIGTLGGPQEMTIRQRAGLYKLTAATRAAWRC
jgi:hypothetical protein